MGLTRRWAVESWLPAAGLLAVGAAVGAGVALLVAPKPGRDLREDIRTKANDLSRRATRATGDARQALLRERGKLEERVESVENGIKDWRAQQSPNLK